MIDVAKIEALAAAATPGPWLWGDDFRGLYGAGPDNAVLEHAPYEGMWLHHRSNREADAALLAAFSPDVARKMVAAIRAAQAVLKDLDGPGETGYETEAALRAALLPFEKESEHG